MEDMVVLALFALCYLAAVLWIVKKVLSGILLLSSKLGEADSRERPSP